MCLMPSVSFVKTSGKSSTFIVPPKVYYMLVVFTYAVQNSIINYLILPTPSTILSNSIGKQIGCSLPTAHGNMTDFED